MSTHSVDAREQSWIRSIPSFPKLDRDDRTALTDRVVEGATCDWDYLVMMALAATLASFGLLQGSTAVVIGAMLVAPLMGPLLAVGLALAQVNVNLFRQGAFSAAIGIALGLGVSIIAGLLNPGFEPSLEMEARGNPDLMDLGIALASGVAAAYAQSRTKVASTLAGVAIAAALVPPLAVVGVALASRRMVICSNAAVLLATNLVAIVLGAYLVFLALGVRTPARDKYPQKWTVRAVVGLVSVGCVLCLPLFHNVQAKVREGLDRPLHLSVSPEVRAAVHAVVDTRSHVEVLYMGRISAEPETGIVVVLACGAELGEDFQIQLERAIHEARREAVAVRVVALVREDAFRIASSIDKRS